ncbi:MAG: sensor histidine kinase [Hyphomicrobiales bacterium]
MINSGEEQIAIIILIGTFGMFILAVGIFFFFVTYKKRLLIKELELNKIKVIHNNELLKHSIKSQEKERKRIAKDLHDEIGGSLSAIHLLISFLEKQQPKEYQDNFIEIKDSISDTINNVRRISRNLLPASLERFGLLDSLSELINRIAKSRVISIALYYSDEPFRFDRDKEVAVYRIIQELINNALKHSEGQNIDIKLKMIKNHLIFSVSDNGKGFDSNNKNSSGFGLYSIESRIELLDGKYKTNSFLNIGTTTIVAFKLN